MAPYDEIRAKYVAHQQPGMMSWEELVGWHLADPDAYCIKTPAYFVMGRAVERAVGPDKIRDLTVRFNAATTDTWHIWAMAGDLSLAWRALPYRMTWFAWERFLNPGNDLHFFSVDRIEALIDHG